MKKKSHCKLSWETEKNKKLAIYLTLTGHARDLYLKPADIAYENGIKNDGYNVYRIKTSHFGF